jgi:hypothetical protein
MPHASSNPKEQLPRPVWFVWSVHLSLQKVVSTILGVLCHFVLQDFPYTHVLRDADTDVSGGRMPIVFLPLSPLLCPH